jgi:hypothetical protein
MGQSEVAAQCDTAVETPLGGFWATASTPRRDGETVSLSEVTWEGRTFVFNHPLRVRVTQRDGGWVFESEDYRLMAYGLERSEAESDFCFMFAECWDEIACEADEMLTRGAIDQKNALLGLVGA